MTKKKKSNHNYVQNKIRPKRCSFPSVKAGVQEKMGRAP